MILKRALARTRTVTRAMAALTALYSRDRSIGHMVGKAWRVSSSEGLVGIKSRLIGLAFPRPYVEPPPPPLSYADWVERFDTVGPQDLKAARDHLQGLGLPPVLILVLVQPETEPEIGRMVAAWRTALHADWHAALLPAASLDDAAVARLHEVAAAHPNLSVLADAHDLQRRRTEFDYTLLCFGTVLLNSLSTYMFLEAATRTGADLVYADSDRIDDAGRRTAPAFKPQFSPEYLARFNYVGDCLLLSRAVPFTTPQASALAALETASYDALVWDLARGRTVEHLPFILSHTVGPRPRVSRPAPAPPDHGPGVSIIIPTRDGVAYLRQCIDSILDRTTYDLDLVEIIIVDNESKLPETTDYFAELSAKGRIRVVEYHHPFNFARINNFGAQHATKEILLFLNNDTIVSDPAWLSKLVHYADQPDAGVVGAKLLYPDGTIQHGGCAAGANMGALHHLLTFVDAQDVTDTDHTREMSVVTGACHAVRRHVYDAVGGFDPVLKITWNDVKFCLAVLEAGFRNIYVAEPLLIHDESKTRGMDNTRWKMDRYFGEAHYTREGFLRYFLDDPSYNPNLSVEEGRTGQLAEPPRVRRPWTGRPGRPARILVLSSTYRFGFGVALVIQQQVQELVALGHEVIIAGPGAAREFDYPGCRRLVLETTKEAAIRVFLEGISIAVIHTPPFFELPGFVGTMAPSLAYDYGEPAAEFFPEPVHSYLLNVEYQKRAYSVLTTQVATISQAVKDETLNRDAIVVGLANSHLPAWSEDLQPQRKALRRKHRWDDSFVVLTVCRFGKNERAYKGIDKMGRIAREFAYLYPDCADDIVWALAGAGSDDDVEQVEALGFTVFPNLPDTDLTGLYTAADAYMSFSRWEGYNLGISQALAMGLPIIASDIPAHREFPITTSNSVLAVCAWLADQVRARKAASPERRAAVVDWKSSVSRFAGVIEGMLADAADPPRRAGASARGCPDRPRG